MNKEESLQTQEGRKFLKKSIICSVWLQDKAKGRLPKANIQPAKGTTGIATPGIQRINMKIKITLRHKDLKANRYPQ